MARETLVVLKDDVDGTDAVESISFSVRSQSYEIDLSEKNAAAFDRALEKWVGAARKTARTRNTQRRGSDNGEARAIRVWAAAHGIKVNDRGRIPHEIIHQYRTAGSA